MKVSTVSQDALTARKQNYRWVLLCWHDVQPLEALGPDNSVLSFLHCIAGVQSKISPTGRSLASDSGSIAAAATTCCWGWIVASHQDSRHLLT